MIIYPAIDLHEGQCVRLVQGCMDNKTVYSHDPGEVARNFQAQGAGYLHIVDLDGAFTGSPKNLAAIRKIAAQINIPFQVGGGLRSRENVETMLAAGAQRVIIGTKAVTSPDFVRSLLKEFGSDRIVLGLDARGGMVATEGWVATSNLSALEFGQQMKALGITTAVYTDVSRDGLLGGPNLNSIEQMALHTGLNIIASGGVSSLQNIRDLKPLESIGVNGAIIGKALYDGKLNLADALTEAAGQ